MERFEYASVQIELIPSKAFRLVTTWYEFNGMQKKNQVLILLFYLVLERKNTAKTRVTIRNTKLMINKSCNSSDMNAYIS